MGRMPDLIGTDDEAVKTLADGRGLISMASFF